MGERGGGGGERKTEMSLYRIRYKENFLVGSIISLK